MTKASSSVILNSLFDTSMNSSTFFIKLSVKIVSSLLLSAELTVSRALAEEGTTTDKINAKQKDKNSDKV